ncbi:hypothetical protein, partial [Pseudomonas aeruginosa]|uniref:hypothetical protein n=1 Tax=Pseudomonas aeruginosa TaxID=287 RepID=UPI001EE16374
RIESLSEQWLTFQMNEFSPYLGMTPPPFAVGILRLLAGCDLLIDGVGRQCGTPPASWKSIWDFTPSLFHEE